MIQPPIGGLGVDAGSRAEIRISDNGPGIPDSIKDKIFQPFFTTKTAGQALNIGFH
jgi:signal transduction histidine kinase